jgi:hypothetical protein
MKTVFHLGFRYGLQAGRLSEQREAGEYTQSDRGKAGFQILLSSKALFSDLIQMSSTGVANGGRKCAKPQY